MSTAPTDLAFYALNLLALFIVFGERTDWRWFRRAKKTDI